jgi:hypothetical protein
MTLRQKQSVFAELTAHLILDAYRLGYEITLGDAHRSIEEATRLGKPNSLHTKKLAIDLNLFKDGHYLSSTESHKILGQWWENQSNDNYKCCWGGRFGDGNHYSIKHGGVM